MRYRLQQLQLELVPTVHKLDHNYLKLVSVNHDLLVLTSSLLSIEPSGPPTDVSATASSPFSIMITWTQPTAALMNGDLTGYVISVTQGDTLAAVQHTTLTDTTLSVSGLHPHTTYICTVAAQTSAGTGPFSHRALVQTPENGERLF